MPKIDRLGKTAALNWLSTPSRFMPHGLSGIISVLIGSQLIFCHSLVGKLNPYVQSNTFPFRVILYAVSTAWNALGGYRIVKLAPANVRPIFKKCALLQLCLSYYVIRFLPHTSSSSFSGHYIPILLLRVIDSLVTMTSVICTLSFFEAAIDISKKSIILGQAIMGGIFGILLLSVYPIQLSLQGEDWWTCIQDRYPLQASGMVAFIYIPATVTFSLILFGATLYQRKILSPVEFGITSLVLTGVCLLSAVLSQELHIPYISTQRIYLPCKDPLFPDSLEGKILHALDFSLYARSVLTFLFGVEFVDK